MSDQPTPTSFLQNQIVCLEQGDRRLYAEVIDTIAPRNLLWARPLLLVDRWDDIQQTQQVTPEQLEDLHEAAHLLLPIDLFRAAIDLELLPILPYLHSSDSKPQTAKPGALRQFIDQVWQNRMSA